MCVNALQESDFFLYHLSKRAVKDIKLSSLCWKVKCKVHGYFLSQEFAFITLVHILNCCRKQRCEF